MNESLFLLLENMMNNQKWSGDEECLFMQRAYEEIERMPRPSVTSHQSGLQFDVSLERAKVGQEWGFS